MKTVVGVFFGGKSVEHEVSIISALQAMENLDQSKYDVVPVYISKPLAKYGVNTHSTNPNFFKELSNSVISLIPSLKISKSLSENLSFNSSISSLK